MISDCALNDSDDDKIEGNSSKLITEHVKVYCRVRPEFPEDNTDDVSEDGTPVYITDTKSG